MTDIVTNFSSLCAVLPFILVVFFFFLIFLISILGKKYNVPISSEFFERIKNEPVAGKIEGAFTFSTGKYGDRRSACDVLFTQGYIVHLYNPVLNVVPGIFGFVTWETFMANIDKGKVVASGMDSIARMNPDPKSVSEPIPFDKIKSVKVSTFKVDSGYLTNNTVIEVGMMRLSIDNRFLGTNDTVLFSKAEMDDVLSLIRRTPLASKLQTA